MTRVSQRARLKRLEDAGKDGDLPLYARRWLGYPLTPEEAALADAQWREVQARPPADLTGLSPEAREWLSRADVPEEHRWRRERKEAVDDHQTPH